MAIILILFGIIIIFFSLSSLIKEGRNSEVNSFKTIYEDKKEEVKDTDLIIAEMRKEFAETILELQKEIIDLREKSFAASDFNISQNEEVETYNESDENDMGKDSIYNGVNVNDIQELYQQGYSIDEISEKLGISKGEILLIKDLYLK
ncbi:MAG: hypothetical protein GX895_04735 [Clostridiales bacterium]|uniref:DUF6115 domain-containing protein n=1 Tax=Clostridium sp. N3C TaxID=1776758 RepID=UPI00092E0DAD|nr:hypothetical protein [Clostridium sp. N3C]NLZ48087.1 hypothetical protein [Clostridiales bacterium]SCN21325.1 hypothetical protein N3C_0101 [Clostridium sp. N3C]